MAILDIHAPHHGRRVAALAGALVLATLAAGCSLPDREEAWPRGDGPVPTADPTATTRPPTGTAPLPDGTRGVGPDGCRQLAAGPWAHLEHGPDPIADVRAGRVPSVPGSGGDEEPDSRRDFTSVDQYRDPSSMVDPGALHAAMAEAGFVEGTEARWGTDRRLALISVSRFADAEGAQRVLTTHLTALCGEAIRATVRDDGAGLTLVRDSGTVRTVFVLDDLEVSVMVCHCYGTSDADREDLVDDWSTGVADELTEPGPDPGV